MNTLTCHTYHCISVLLVSIVLSTTLQAQTHTPQNTTDVLREKLNQIATNIQVERISKSKIDGLYTINIRDSRPFYVDSAGEWLIQGTLYAMSPNGLVDTYLVDKLNNVKDSQTIIFPATGQEKTQITVFTDIDCGYCRQFHREVPQLNKNGVSVRYLAFPRAGVGSESYRKIETAWCAENTRKALTTFKSGGHINYTTCPQSPIKQHLQLVRQLELRGTPAVFTAKGEHIGGYRSASDILKVLNLP